MASTEKSEEESIFPPDAFKYLKSIRLHQPQIFDVRAGDLSVREIPPPSHRLIKYKADDEEERMLRVIREAYVLPSYGEGCFRELLQWLHRFDFTQDDERYFCGFLQTIMDAEFHSCLQSTAFLETQSHVFFLCDPAEGMNGAYANQHDTRGKKLAGLTHEFTPALQVERDSDTEESFLPLRFGFPVARLRCYEKNRGERGSSGSASYHLVFHPIDKSFWMVVDHYMGLERFDYPLDHDDAPEFKHLDNEELIQWLSYLFGKRKDKYKKWGDGRWNNFVLAEAFRLGSEELWFPQGLGLSELDGGAGFDGNKSEEPVSQSNYRGPPPTIDLCSIPKVPLFPDTEPLQVRFARHSHFQRYLAKNGVVKGRSWLSVSPVPD